MKSNVVRIHSLDDEDHLGIVSGIPIPPPRRRPPKFVRQLLAAKMNDSFLTPLTKSACYQMAKKLGIRITFRWENETYNRVWRKTP